MNEPTALMWVPPIYTVSYFYNFCEILQLLFFGYLSFFLAMRMGWFLLGKPGKRWSWEEPLSRIVKAFLCFLGFHIFICGDWAVIVFGLFVAFSPAFCIVVVMMDSYRQDEKDYTPLLRALFRKYLPVSERSGRLRNDATPNNLGFNSLDKKCGRPLQCLDVFFVSVVPGLYLLRFCYGCDKLV